MKDNSKTKEKQTNTTNNNKKAFLEAFENTLGFVSDACKKANISRVTFYEYLKTDALFEQAVNDIKESFLDLTETKLMENIKAGKESSIFYKLNNHGKSRGYNVQEVFEDDKPSFNP